MFLGSPTWELKRVGQVTRLVFTKSVLTQERFLKSPDVQRFLQRPCGKCTIAAWLRGEQAIVLAHHNMRGEWHACILLCFMERHGELRTKISQRSKMYSPKRRFRLFRHPAFTVATPTVDDTTVYTYTWSEQASSPSQRYATIDVDDTGDNAITARWTATDGAEGPYVSINKGSTWNRRVTGMTFGASSVTSTPCIARSAPSTMYSQTNTGYLYKTTDSGASWTELTAAGSRNWGSVNCSSTGTIVVASVENGYIYKSTDGGSTWSELTASGSRGWEQVFVSDDGNVIACIVFGGYIYVSTNGGTSFTPNTSFGTKSWRGLSGSADGSVLFAAAVGTGRTALSTDTGATWTSLTSFGSAGDYWNTAVSVNGNKLVAAQYNGYIYVSQNKGSTWTEQTTAGTRAWEGIGISGDGSTIMAGTLGAAKLWVATGS